MEDPELSPRSDAASRGQRAEAILAALLTKAGWKVRSQAERGEPSRIGMVVSRGKAAYAVEVKSAPEGRSDRLIPLWSQACLEAARVAKDRYLPLAVVSAPKIAPRVAEQVLAFASEFAPNAAVGVVDFAGFRVFRGPHLDGLDSDDEDVPRTARSVRGESADLFSDLNQWLLKVLLAPELPDRLLSSPRGRYHNASQLARAANVSVMSASRFLRQLEREGHLDESKAYLRLGRREELFARWHAAAVRRVSETPMRFLLRRETKVELAKMLRSGRACLGLFAAAEALGFGFVHGVPPHVYVQHLGPTSIAAWKNIVPAERGEAPDMILRRAFTPQSVFRGIVRADDRPVSDILQVWLDVSSHPSRGQEQADLIRRRVLDAVIRERQAHG